jgi:hypothetical protein
VSLKESAVGQRRRMADLSKKGLMVGVCVLTDSNSLKLAQWMQRQKLGSVLAYI